MIHGLGASRLPRKIQRLDSAYDDDDYNGHVSPAFMRAQAERIVRQEAAADSADKNPGEYE